MRRIILIISILSALHHSILGQNDMPSLISQTEKSVCIVETFNFKGQPLMRGTGFFITPAGNCVTNYHIIKGASSITLRTIDGNSYEVEEIIKSSEFYDLAVLRISTDKDISYLKLTSILPLKGEKIITIGNPKGLFWSVSDGIVSGVRQLEKGIILQITAPLSEGNSGSPVLNEKGEAIGIASFRLLEGENLNFAVYVGIIDSIEPNPHLINALNPNTEIKISLPNDQQPSQVYIDTLFLQRDTIDYFSREEFDNRLFRYLNDYIDKYINSAYGYVRKAQLCRLNSDFNTAYDLLNKAIEVEPDNPDLYLKRGEFITYVASELTSLEPSQRISKALADFNKYGSYSNQNRILSLKEIADLYYWHNEFQLAMEFYSNYLVECYKEAIFVNPEVYLNRGRIYWKLDDFENAYEDFEELNMLQPNCENKEEIALLLFEYEHYSDASIFLTDDCLYTPDHYYYKSFVLYKIGSDLHKARQLIDRSLIWYDKNADLENLNDQQKNRLENYLRLSAILYGESGNSIAVIKDLQKILEVKPTLSDDYNFCVWLAMEKQEAKDYLGAIKDINRLIERYPKNEKLFNLKGNILYDMNDFIGSVKAYNTLIELNPNEGQYYSLRAFAKYALKDHTGACSDWSQAGELGYYKAYESIKSFCNK